MKSCKLCIGASLEQHGYLTDLVRSSGASFINLGKDGCEDRQDPALQSCNHCYELSGW